MTSRAQEIPSLIKIGFLHLVSMTVRVVSSKFGSHPISRNVPISSDAFARAAIPSAEMVMNLKPGIESFTGQRGLKNS